jgi:hypothetical protein
MSSACADARSAERSSGAPQGAARAARDARRRPRVGPCRARVLRARRTDHVSPPRPSCAIAKRSGDYAAYVFEVWPGLPVEPPRPHLRPQPRPLSVSPEARPAEPILGTNQHRGVLPQGPVALTLPAAWLADNGRAGLRSTMTCAVWRAARTRGGFSCRSGVVHLVFAFGMFSVFRSVAVVLHSYLPARWPPPVPEGGGRAWARAG